MVPLILTGLRIAMAPAFLIVDRRQYGAEWLLLLVWAAMVTDWLDGAVARRWNAVSTAGKLLDPFADALFCMIVFYVFARPHTSEGFGEFVFRMPLWGLGILIAREALVTFVMRPVAWACGVVVAANWIGKAKTGLQFALMMLVLVPWVAEREDSLWRGLATAAFYSVLLFSVGSAARYTVGVVGAISQIRRARREGR
jgi:CDP-diacylglycerol--glycerol-3-phosphate 3-phosphatidyltransferase